jgi:hypothetical protein
MRSIHFFLTTLLSVTLLLSACRTAQKFTESGDYDGAIDFCISKLEGRKKKKAEHVKGLEIAFAKAQDRDFIQIDRLKADSRPENWARINVIHRHIAERQDKIHPLLPLRDEKGYSAKFNFADVASMERESRSKAAEYLYNRAQNAIARAEKGDRRAGRDAYYDLVDLERSYYKDYLDKDALIDQARELGTSHVIFEVRNNSNKILPRDFNERVLAFSKQDLDSEWKRFHFEQRPGMNYDYKLVFKIKSVDISPERIRERAYSDEKEIEDGWDYVLDSKGNVAKDTLGNDLKVKRYATIRANVLEVHQSKAARLAGLIEVTDLVSNNLLDTRNVGTEVIFENYASTFTGDSRALSSDSRNRIGNRPLPFPIDDDLLMQAADRLKPSIREEIRCCKGIF